MGLLDHYRQYEAVSEEEHNVGLRELAAERRREALEVVPTLDLSQTTSPRRPPSSVVGAVTFVARAGLHRYLDPHAVELRNALAHAHDVPAAQLVVGNGAAQLLTSAAHALLSDGDELVTPWPSYPLYPLMASRSGATAVSVDGFGPDAILGAITPRTRVVALCNPNDPTGAWIDPTALRGLLEALPERVALLLDEALIDYVDAAPRDAALQLTHVFPRLLVFRSFSKAWGLAGLRVGYAVGGPGSEALLETIEPELGVSEPSQAGALEALRDADRFVGPHVRSVQDERLRTAAALREIGARVAGSQTSALWIGVDGLDGAELAARLDRAKVTVATGARFGDTEHVRAQVISRQTGERLVEAVRGAMRNE